MDDVNICNIALSRIGVSLKISSLQTERTKEAIELRNVYEMVRDKVLGAAPWPFARKVVPLALTGDAPLRWKYRYAYPNDCVAMRALFPSSLLTSLSPEALRQYLRAHKTPYELELVGDGTQTIVTDLEQSYAEYTVRVTNSAVFDAAFVSAFAWGLAAEVALPLAKTIDHSRNAGAQYSAEINTALAKALNEEGADPFPESEFVMARL